MNWPIVKTCIVTVTLLFSIKSLYTTLFLVPNSYIVADFSSSVTNGQRYRREPATITVGGE